MSRVRVYVPATTATLAGLDGTGAVTAGTVHAVTPALREAYATGDTDELEYAALLAAAADSLRLLAADTSVPPRRVVLAADVPDAAASADPAAGGAAGAPSALRLAGPLTLQSVASVHVDGEDAAADVAAAVAAVPAADAGDDDAAFTVSGAEGHELLWYDVTEIADLVAGG